MEKIRVLVFPQDGSGVREEKIANDWKEMQKIVGGFFEAVSLLPEGYTLYCNEDGLAENLPPNPYTRLLGRDIASMVLCPDGHHILGTFFVSKEDEEGESVSLTDEDISFILSDA